MAAVLIGGAGAALSAGSAEAATGCGVEISWEAWVGGQDLTCEDKTFSWESTSTLGNLSTSVVRALQPVAGDYLFALRFIDAGGETNPFDFTYTASITDPSRTFSAVDLDSKTDGFQPSLLTTTFTFAGGNSPIVLASVNGDGDMEAVIGAPSQMTVQNVYDGAGALLSFENSYQQSVPGPLPVLGAGMAFGFSRKLRRRIDGARVKD